MTSSLAAIFCQNRSMTDPLEGFIPKDENVSQGQLKTEGKKKERKVSFTKAPPLVHSQGQLQLPTMTLEEKITLLGNNQTSTSSSSSSSTVTPKKLTRSASANLVTHQIPRLNIGQVTSSSSSSSSVFQTPTKVSLSDRSHKGSILSLSPRNRTELNPPLELRSLKKEITDFFIEYFKDWWLQKEINFSARCNSSSIPVIYEAFHQVVDKVIINSIINRIKFETSNDAARYILENLKIKDMQQEKKLTKLSNVIDEYCTNDKRTKELCKLLSGSLDEGKKVIEFLKGYTTNFPLDEFEKLYYHGRICLTFLDATEKLLLHTQTLIFAAPLSDPQNKLHSILRSFSIKAEKNIDGISIFLAPKISFKWREDKVSKKKQYAAEFDTNYTLNTLPAKKICRIVPRGLSVRRLFINGKIINAAIEYTKKVPVKSKVKEEKISDERELISIQKLEDSTEQIEVVEMKEVEKTNEECQRKVLSIIFEELYKDTTFPQHDKESSIEKLIQGSEEIVSGANLLSYIGPASFGYATEVLMEYFQKLYEEPYYSTPIKGVDAWIETKEYSGMQEIWFHMGRCLPPPPIPYDNFRQFKIDPDKIVGRFCVQWKVMPYQKSDYCEGDLIVSKIEVNMQAPKDDIRYFLKGLLKAAKKK